MFKVCFVKFCWEFIILKGGGGGGLGEGFDVVKIGDVWIGFVGFLFVGKLILFSNLVGVYFEVVVYEFIILIIVFGVIRYKGVKI